jgi:uncharacterized protein (TIGR03083 family)
MLKTATPLVEAERNDLADFLETLTPQQWAAPSLCEHWTVRDVVAHVVSYEGAGAAELTRRFTQGRFMLNRINDVSLDQQRKREPDELLGLLRQNVTPHGLTSAFGGRIALVDTLMHHQDIRRALGLPRDVPPERLRVALPFAFIAPPIKAMWNVRGVKLVATDVDWSGGAGPEARGAGEAVLIAMGGRRGVACDLTGPGAARLVPRLG